MSDFSITRSPAVSNAQNAGANDDIDFFEGNENIFSRRFVFCSR